MSPAPIKVTALVSGAEAVNLRLGAAGDTLRARLRAAVDRTALEVAEAVPTRYLVGPRPKRLITGGPKASGRGSNTGKLGRSINVLYFESGNRIGASVGTNVEYGRVWELGFSGRVHVREHLRHSYLRRVEGKKKRKRVAETKVRAHEREVNLAPRPFLAPALDEARARFRERVLRAAIGAP